MKKERSRVVSILILSASMMAILLPLSGNIPSARASDPFGTFFPRLDIDSAGDVHVVWWTAFTGDNEIYYIKLNGKTGEPYFSQVQITASLGYSGRPDIAVDSKDQVHIAWLDQRNGQSEIYYTKLDNNGNTLIDDLRLTFAPGDSVRPCIVVDDNDNVHIAWYDGRDGNHEIYYTKLDNNGNTLIDDVRVTNAPKLSQRPYIDVDSKGDVHFSWMDTRDGGDYEMYYTKLDGNNGNKLVPDKRLTFNAGLSGRNALVVDSHDNVHITFMNEVSNPFPGNIEIYYVKLDNNGNALIDNDNDGLADNIRLTDQAAKSVRPDMALDSADNLSIVWVEERDGNREIYYTKLDNNGNTLIDDLRVSYSRQISDRTYVAVDNSNDVHIVWQDDRAGRPELFYSKLDSNGNSLIDDRRITVGHPFQDRIVVASDGLGNAQVVWADERTGNIDLFYTKIDGDDGSVLIDDKQLTDPPISTSGHYSQTPSIALDGSGSIHLAWQDNRQPHGNFELYHTKLDSNGNSLTAQRRHTFDAGYSINPKVALDPSGNAHIVWQDTFDPDTEILGGPTSAFYTKLDNNGNPLIPPKKITGLGNLEADIAVDSVGNVHIVWRGLFYTKLDNNGNILVDHIVLTNGVGSSRPSLAIDSSDNLHIVWMDRRDFDSEIYYTKLDSNGKTLVDDLRVTNDAAISSDPVIGVDPSGDVVVVWSDSRDGNPEIYFAKLDNNGNRKTPDVRITEKDGKSFFPEIAVEKSTGHTHIAFLDLNDDHPGVVELYYTNVDGTGTKSIPVTRMSFTTNHPPTANAGPDQIVKEGDLVTLDGGGSSDVDATGLSYSWVQVAGPPVAFIGPGSANPKFTAPQVAGDTILAFELKVTDGIDESGPDMVNVTVKNASTSFSPTSLTGAPSARARHTAVWTGGEMIVWGGADGATYFKNGARYNPVTNMWTPMSTVNAPSVRQFHTAVWTGTEMVVWGGTLQNTGARYNPATDIWTPMSTVNAPAGRNLHTAVWTGTEMVVWGGMTSSGLTGTGGRYNPATNTWTTISTLNAPSPRQYHTAVWTGAEMIIWGGNTGSSRTDTGARYNPSTDTWTPITMTDAPGRRDLHTAVWTGAEMIVWGGNTAGGRTNMGAKYNPSTDSWSKITAVGAPSARDGHTAVWTGTEMIVWSGFTGSARTDTGGRYDPNTNTWLATPATGAPAGRTVHTAVWTGSEMIVWGGLVTPTTSTNTGSVLQNLS